MLLTAVVSLNVETAAILTAASTSEHRSIKGRVLLLMATFRSSSDDQQHRRLAIGSLFKFAANNESLLLLYEVSGV